jgi:hypothetical protein
MFAESFSGVSVTIEFPVSENFRMRIASDERVQFDQVDEHLCQLWMVKRLTNIVAQMEEDPSRETIKIGE